MEYLLYYMNDDNNITKDTNNDEDEDDDDDNDPGEKVFDLEVMAKLYRDIAGDGRRSVVRFFAKRTREYCNCLETKVNKEKEVTPTKRGICLKCHEVIPFKLLMKCSRCTLAHYCSRECQKLDWKGHKNQCFDMKARKERAATHRNATAIKNSSEDGDANYGLSFTFKPNDGSGGGGGGGGVFGGRSVESVVLSRGGEPIYKSRPKI